MSYETFLLDLFREFDSLLGAFVFDGYHALSGYLRAPWCLATVLYIVLFGVSIMQGWLKMSVEEFTKSTLLLIFVYLAVFNWDFFSSNIVRLMTQGAEQLGAALLQSVPGYENINVHDGIVSALQTILNTFEATFIKLWKAGNFHDFAPYFAAIVILIGAVISIGIAAFEILFAKMMLAILFVTAPLFESFLMFKVTKGFFERWLGALAGFSFLIVMLSGALALFVVIMNWAISEPNTTGHFTIGWVFPIAIVSLISAGLLLKVASLAMHIGGTVAQSSATSFIAGWVTGSMRSGMSWYDRIRREEERRLRVRSGKARLDLMQREEEARQHATAMHNASRKFD